jgi:photosystem II stability/assembly factor-like uncharacterized protein
MKNNRLILVFLGFLCFPGSSSLPAPGIKETTPALQSLAVHLQLKNESIFKHLKWRCVGPQFQGGRISSITGHPGNPFVIYVSAGSGNLWKTINNGTTWEPIFDNESTFAIGAIAISASDPNIIWVGTGEDLMARSSYAGTGVFKSTDAGKTWQNMGLHDSHHINRIVIHPHNPDIVYAAAMGHQYTFNEERGLFKTIDGGKTWEKVLYISEKVGVTEVGLDPANSDTVLAAAWERDRKAWNNTESGPGSGIYKSTDAGKTWKKLTSGFPDGIYVGRIGLAFAASNPHVIYALLDNQEPKPLEKKEETPKKGLKIIHLEKMSPEEFLKIPLDELETFLRDNRVPGQYTASSIREMVLKKTLTPQVLAQYLLDAYADRKLHETDVKGGEVYRSEDKGETWRKVSREYFDNFFNTYGYSFCDIRVSPDDENFIYILGIRMLASKDGGQTFWHIGGKKNVHVDHHALWIDPQHPDRLLNGNDGGLNFSYDRGETWQKINNIPIAEFYAISVDMKKPYHIYGGTQDNGSLFGPADHIPEHGVPDPWQHLGDGDGFFVFVDPGDSNTVYYEFQFGALLRKNLSSGTAKNIMPQTQIGEPALRCNWMTPFIISPHNRFTLYFGAQKLFKSLDQGETWHCISPDLTTAPGPGKQGDVTYGTITTISESEFQPGLIYVGTDDGNIQATHNDGVTWDKINVENVGLPGAWVSRVIASRYDKALVYAALTGYRQDDFKCYLYRSPDQGKTWTSIQGNLPDESVNVIREDPKNENILYVGTDLGIYVSMDKGGHWYSLCCNLPTTPVHDLTVHPRDNELVIGTHGRGAFIMDAEPMQTFIEKTTGKTAHLFDIRPVKPPVSRANGEWALEKHRDAYIYYYLDSPREKLEITVLEEEKSSGKDKTKPQPQVIKKLEGTNERGINCARWDLTFTGGTELGQEFGTSGEYVKPGTYTVRVSAGKTILTGKIEVKSRQ